MINQVMHNQESRLLQYAMRDRLCELGWREIEESMTILAARRPRSGGPEALEDRSPRPKQIWNRIVDGIREQIAQLALDEPELSPRGGPMLSPCYFALARLAMLYETIAPKLIATRPGGPKHD